jgi:hypothetical protein
MAKLKVLPFSLAITLVLLKVSPFSAINSILANGLFKSRIRLNYTFSLYYTRLTTLKAR